MKYAVAWVSLGSRETIYEVYDSNDTVDCPQITHETQPIIFASCTPLEQRTWNARLTLWTLK
jgi:hypothetical protein